MFFRSHSSPEARALDEAYYAQWYDRKTAWEILDWVADRVEADHCLYKESLKQQEVINGQT